MTNIVRDSEVVELNNPPTYRYGDKVKDLRLLKMRNSSV